MKLLAAPMEGLTGWVWRNAHRDIFGGIDAYGAPFISPTGEPLHTCRGAGDLLPERNSGVPLIPQLLTNRADDFLRAAEQLAEMGYTEVNLNLGCPSGTVTAKKKGSGFLTLPAELDAFLEQVYTKTPLPVSVKTRIGFADEAEWPALLEVYNRYPIQLLTVHARLRQDFYKGVPREACFAYAAEHSKNPLCMNGNLFTPEDCRTAEAGYPQLAALMPGRGLMTDPALARQVKGGAPASREELRLFHDTLLRGYRETLSGQIPVLGRMKELWFYMGALFADAERQLKKLRKARTLSEYMTVVDVLFDVYALSEHPFQEESCKLMG